MVGYDHEKTLHVSHSTLAGILGGSVTRVCVSPIDVLKIRFQLQPEKGHGQKYYGIIQAVRTIFQEEGIRAFWKGHIPAQCLSMIYGGMQFGSFQHLTKIANDLVPHTRDDHLLRAVVNYSCGCVSGGLATIAGQPVDVLRTRFAAQKEPMLFPKIHDALSHMLKHEGVRGFYRGTTPALIQMVPYSGLQFMSYSFLQAVWCHVSLKEGSLSHLVCGSGAGILSKGIVYPFDVVKKRLQVQGFNAATVSTVIDYSSFRNCISSIWKNEGFSGFYKGFTVAVFKSCATSGLVFLTYEWFSELLRTW
ncbi:mitochondrial thiamine pyrophosphate carrier-like [Clavelina lepadiformis]|uniref:mitochondrial thiamine pyrophosphate carrier-like n=1 Tax=Clavelina lepadiformis TaxID=159417 RepID=UPI00404256DD